MVLEYISSSEILNAGTAVKIDEPLAALTSAIIVYAAAELFNKSTGRETFYETAAKGIRFGCEKIRQKIKDR